MLKRISTDQLTVGMYVHEFCGSWMDHPFWRAKFALSDEADLRRIHASSIREVWIDTSKGLDVSGGVSAATAKAEVERELEFAASQPMAWLQNPSSLVEEIHRAKAICRKSKAAVNSLFSEARLGKAIDVDDCLPLVEEISDSVLRNPAALISVARLKTRDEYTYMHSVAVCALMVALGRTLGLDAELLREAGLAGMLHDVGKTQVPLGVLNKPGKLTDEEFALMKTHPVQGHELLKGARILSDTVLDVCLHHHERIDGGGYPHRLKGDEISLLAKMGAVCDVYDAVTSNRPYKRGWDPGESLRQMAQWKGHFDPVVFQAFVKTVGIYPTGSLVRLKSGRLAVVTEQNPQALLTPKVKVFFSTKSNQRIAPEELNLAGPWIQDRIAGCESPADWPFADLDQLWGGGVQAR